MAPRVAPGTLNTGREKNFRTLLHPSFQESTELYDAEDILLKLDHRAKGGGETGCKASCNDVTQHLLAAVLPGIEDERKIHIRRATGIRPPEGAQRRAV